jgi:AcrR family transcriptional regulator
MATRWSREARPGGRSARVRSAVLDAAIVLLEERGFEGTELPEIARRAGVNPTTVYRRWGTKAGLVGEALLERARPLTPTPDTGSVRSDLERLLVEGGELIRSPQVLALLEVLLREGPAPSGEVVEARDRFWAAHLDEFRQIVDRGVARGELPPGVDPAALVELVIGPVLVRLFMGLDVSSEDIVTRALAALSLPSGPTRRRSSRGE